MARKYKNPEKYIDRLKAQLKRMDEWGSDWRDRCLAAQGKLLMDWEPHEKEQNCTDYFKDVLPGERVAIIGIVKAVENKIDLSCKNKHGRLVIQVEETRLLPD